MLNFTEAFMFVRAGDDMRRTAFPSGDFVRFLDNPRPIAGYEVTPYFPSTEDINANDWRRA